MTYLSFLSSHTEQRFASNCLPLTPSSSSSALILIHRRQGITRRLAEQGPEHGFLTAPRFPALRTTRQSCAAFHFSSITWTIGNLGQHLTSVPDILPGVQFCASPTTYLRYTRKICMKTVEYEEIKQYTDFLIKDSSIFFPCNMTYVITMT